MLLKYPHITSFFRAHRSEEDPCQYLEKSTRLGGEPPGEDGVKAEREKADTSAILYSPYARSILDGFQLKKILRLHFRKDVDFFLKR